MYIPKPIYTINLHISISWTQVLTHCPKRGIHTYINLSGLVYEEHRKGEVNICSIGTGSAVHNTVSEDTIVESHSISRQSPGHLIITAAGATILFVAIVFVCKSFSEFFTVSNWVHYILREVHLFLLFVPFLVICIKIITTTCYT